MPLFSAKFAQSYPVVGEDVEEGGGEEVERVLGRHGDVSEVDVPKETLETLARRNHVADRDRNAVVGRAERPEKEGENHPYLFSCNSRLGNLIIKKLD